MEHPGTPLSRTLAVGYTGPSPLPPNPSRFMVAAHSILSGRVPLLAALRDKDVDPRKLPAVAVVFESREWPCVVGVAVLRDDRTCEWSASWNAEAPCRSAPRWQYPDVPTTSEEIEAFLQQFALDCRSILEGEAGDVDNFVAVCAPQWSIQLLDTFYECEGPSANH